MSEVNIEQLFGGARVIAVVGLSAKPHRASFSVAAYLQKTGYRIVPINPNEAGTHILDELCFKSIVDFNDLTGTHIDIVDCFRRSEDIPEIVAQALTVKPGCIWMQLGISNVDAQRKAEAAGIVVVSDKCMKIEHAKHATQVLKKDFS